MYEDAGEGTIIIIYLSFYFWWWFIISLSSFNIVFSHVWDDGVSCTRLWIFSRHLLSSRWRLLLQTWVVDFMWFQALTQFWSFFTGSTAAWDLVEAHYLSQTGGFLRWSNLGILALPFLYMILIYVSDLFLSQPSAIFLLKIDFWIWLLEHWDGYLRNSTHWKYSHTKAQTPALNL